MSLIAALPVTAEPAATVGFVGLGVMGSAMATRLLHAGRPVVVWNRDRAKADRLVALGAYACDNPAEVARAAGRVFGCLLDTVAVEQVYAGPGGLLEGVHPGHVLVEHATFAPSAARALHGEVARRGGQFLDAPVTGGPDGAAAGTLTAMVGGDQTALDTVAEPLGAYAAHVVRVGEVGAGLALKLCNQLLVSCHLAAAAEAAALIDRLGLQPEVCERVLGSGWAASTMLTRTLPRAATRNYASGGATVGGFVEVQQLVGALARDCGVTLAAFPAAVSLFDLGVRHGWAGSDPAVLTELAYPQAGRRVRQEPDAGPVDVGAPQ